MRKLLLNVMSLSLLLIATTAMCKPVEDLATILNSKENVFDIPRTAFFSESKKVNRMIFKWNSNKKQDIHYPAWGNSPKLKCFGLNLLEANVFFKDEKFSGMHLSFYNRGDAKKRLKAKAFFALKKKLSDALTKWSGDSKPFNHKYKRVAKKKVYCKVWTKGNCAILVKYSYSGKKKSSSFKSEYINVDFIAFDKKSNPKKSSYNFLSGLKAGKRKDNTKTLISNIKKTDNGDVYIDNIPMVDQGQKGYCAVAATERVLKYYGMNVDQNMLAQIANTSQRGTSLKEMEKALKRAGTKFGVKLQTVDRTIKFIKILKKYNKYAKRHHAPQIRTSMEQLDPEVYSDYRLKDSRGEAKFFKLAKAQINKGIPVMWTVYLGIVKDVPKDPQGSGGHLRLIIGYNDKKKELLYSDTWGKGHELKRMTYDQAWIMTTGAFVMPPRKGR